MRNDCRFAIHRLEGLCIAVKVKGNLMRLSETVRESQTVSRDSRDIFLCSHCHETLVGVSLESKRRLSRDFRETLMRLP